MLRSQRPCLAQRPSTAQRPDAPPSGLPAKVKLYIIEFVAVVLMIVGTLGIAAGVLGLIHGDGAAFAMLPGSGTLGVGVTLFRRPGGSEYEGRCPF